jgi:hypothetical protein
VYAAATTVNVMSDWPTAFSLAHTCRKKLIGFHRIAGRCYSKMLGILQLREPPVAAWTVGFITTRVSNDEDRGRGWL